MPGPRSVRLARGNSGVVRCTGMASTADVYSISCYFRCSDNDREEMLVKCLRLVTVCVAVFALSLQAQRSKPLRGTPPDRLRDVVRTERTITVIAALALDEKWRPDGHLTPAKASEQRKAIRKKKDVVFARLRPVRFTVKYDYDDIPVFAARVDSEALEKLLGDQDLEFISEDRSFEPILAQSIPIVKADLAWSRGYSGSGQVIAIVDTGFQRDHPFLGPPEARVAGEACYTTSDGEGFKQTCPLDENGEPKHTGPKTALPCTVPPGDPHYPALAAGCEHGTRVAGVAGGRAYAGVTYSGVAKDVRFYFVKVAGVTYSCNIPCPTGWQYKIWESDVLAALTHLYGERETHRFAAVNMSLQLKNTVPPGGMDDYGADCDGPDEEPVWAQRIGQFHAAGIPFVTGSGNDSTYNLRAPGLPGCISTAITVGATTDSGAMTIAPYSNSGEVVDLLAPGGNTTVGTGITTSDAPSGTAESYGTSFAAPHVAGAFAILRQLSPTAPVDVLRSYLVQSGEPKTDTRLSPALTRPLIDIDAALDLVDTQPPSSPGFVVASAISGSEVSLTWTQSTDTVGIQDYLIERKDHISGPWTAVGTASAQATAFADSTGTPAKVYAYRVVARDAALNRGVSAVDYATTVMYDNDPIQEPPYSMTSLRGAHIATLREAVDAWRLFAGLERAFTYEVPTGLVSAAHVLTIVDAFSAARTTIGLAAFTYSGVTPPAAAGAIDDDHIQQLRDAMK